MRMTLTAVNRGWICLFLLAIISLGCTTHREGNNYRMLTNDEGYYGELAWSPDGERIIYRQSTDNPDQFEIMTLDTQNIESVEIPTSDLFRASNLIWLNEEEVAYYGSSSYEDSKVVAIQNLTDSTTEVLFITDEVIYDWCWLPTEQKYLYITQNPPQTIRPVHGNKITAYDPSTNTFEYVYRSRVNDIPYIACSLTEGKVAFIERNRDENEDKLYVLDYSSAADLELLHETNRRITEPSWSPDGKWIAVREVSGRSNRIRRRLTFVSTDGGGVHEISNPPWLGQTLTELYWSPVSDTILLRHMDGAIFTRNYSLYLYDFEVPETSVDD